MKLFLDANILIDVLQNREGFVETSMKILQLGFEGKCDLYASDITFATLSFFARKHRTLEELYEVLQSLRDRIEIAPTGAEAIDWALSQKLHDFEDALQYYAALRCGAEFIITRNQRDYPLNVIPVLSPAEFLQILKT